MRSLVLASVCLAALGCPGPVQVSDSSAAALFEGLRANEVRTIDKALTHLPPAYREHYVLVFAGGASQSGSESNPRVLAFGRDAHLILTFNGGTDQAGAQSLEVAEFNQATAQYEYSFIVLDGHGEATRSEVNPAQCLACHGDKPHTIFSDYPQWPGFYGSTRDALQPGSDEQVAFLGYLANSVHHPRYSKLSRTFMTKRPTGEPQIGVLHHPNNMYGKLLARRQAMRLAHDLISQPDVRPKLLSYLAWNFHTQQGQCPEWSQEIKDTVFKPLTRFAQERTASRYPSARFRWAARNADEVELPLERFVLSFGSTEVFTERMAPVTRVSAARGPDARIGYNDGLDELSVLVATALVQKLPEASAFFVSVSSAELAAQRGFAERYADGSSEIFDEVLPRVRLTSSGCEALAVAAAGEW